MNIADFLGAQKRQRRLQFWGGFIAIAVVGGLWAFLIREPLDPLFDEFDGDFVEAEPAFDAPMFEEVETTVGFQDFDTTGTAGEGSSTTVTAPIGPGGTQPPLTPTTTTAVAPETSETSAP